MKTVDKAMNVLNQFSFEKTEIGLSELARLAGLDKAATRRLLIALSKHGFIEQIEETRKYRLGTGFLRLANIREATVPLTQAAQEVVNWLCTQTDETCHVSVPLSDRMAAIAIRMPRRGHVINVMPSEHILYHATSAGYAYLSAANPKSVARILTLNRAKIAPGTLTTKTDVLAKIEQTRTDGFAACRNTLENGVASIAMPFFVESSEPAGTISIAVPEDRMSETHQDALVKHLRSSVARIELSLKGHEGFNK